MARATGVSPASVQRLWAANDINLPLTRTFKLSKDARFEEKFWDVIGLYLDPPEKAVVLCCDEKSQCRGWSVLSQDYPWILVTSRPPPMTTFVTGRLAGQGREHPAQHSARPRRDDEPASPGPNVEPFARHQTRALPPPHWCVHHSSR